MSSYGPKAPRTRQPSAPTPRPMHNPKMGSDHMKYRHGEGTALAKKMHRIK